MSTALAGRPVLFGEVLFDRFPGGETVLGGAPFNVAWHLQAFGARPLMISRIGDDPLGARIRDTMHAWGMDDSGIQLDRMHPTGTVDVHIEDGEPRFDIVQHRAWDYIDADRLPALDQTALLYHGSLVLRSQASRQALHTLLQRLDAPVFIDVNLRPPWWEADEVHERLHAARWAKLNEDELALLAPPGADLEARARALLRRHDLELLITTRGAAGALAHHRDGRRLQVSPPATDNLVDTVGAGDAFATVCILGLLHGWPLEQTLQRAQAFASAVVGIRGATPGDPDFYTPFRKDWKLT
ncbi:carbohydrate kinase [Thiohalobacter sp. IOR34]|uniref:carbohydrate kinase family protein n=1 Tax=Thiohalobacter sp. IOR34 TaxID=3057176 RepID=UPI0025AFC9F5|nr:carbohydrate kinase [Thiohalobacter sp. IOR34]WJW74298.1 carbohydrate kinase [Thiohalobacter sp. IOR34]